MVVVADPSCPPPERIVQSTCAPETGLPEASVALTTRGFGNGKPISALWVLPETIASADATAAIAVSVNETCTVGALCSAARIVLAPSAAPRVYSTWAVPSAPVVVEVLLRRPPPETIAQSTTVPATGLPQASVTRTPAGWGTPGAG